ncbi:MAG: AAA family ATPase [Gammaproteobacteria bacterium]|nr:AAA family ATPase [Gammaproteobacteria bacterium]
MSAREPVLTDHEWDQISLLRTAKLAPRPTRLADTGLSQTFMADLIAKHLFDRGTLSLGELSSVLAITGSIIEGVLNFMRTEARVEIRPGQASSGGLAYTLTERGRVAALDAMMRSGYLGPCPVPIRHYAQIARAQTIHNRTVTHDAMRHAFEDVVLDDEMLDRLGPALNSGRAMFLYGEAGTGKTYISQRLARLFKQPVLIPHAVAIDDTVVQLFDPLVHKRLRQKPTSDNLKLEKGHDARFIVCERPVVITGGELTTEMLEVHYEPSTRLYEAPLQLKANNGLFIIDDMGRQKAPPAAIFNRWIIPMEEKRDYLTLGSGRHFTVPFDVVLVFSTNIHPLELADEAFLRRIGYKIEFRSLTPEQYEHIWCDACASFNVAYEPHVLHFVINELHTKRRVALLPCHPRDLLGMAVDHAAYEDSPNNINIEHLQWAWDNYFVSIDGQA